MCDCKTKCKCSRGHRGKQGPPGLTVQGPPGPIGNTGEKGIQGNVGNVGIQGPTGIRGNVGIQGPTGIRGPTGESLIVDSYGYGNILLYDNETDTLLKSKALTTSLGLVGDQINISGDIIPAIDTVYDIGNSNNYIKDVYIGGKINFKQPVPVTTFSSNDVKMTSQDLIASTTNNTDYSLGVNENDVVYTTAGFSTPFLAINLKDNVSKTGPTGTVGWRIYQQGQIYGNNFDLLAQPFASYNTTSGLTGYTGQSYSLISNKGNTGSIGPTGTSNWSLSNNKILYPTENSNDVKIGLTGTKNLSKLEVYDEKSSSIITSINPIFYNPYNTNSVPTNPLWQYYNYTVPGTYIFNYAGPAITLYYLIVGGGGNGANASQDLVYGGGGGAGGQFLNNTLTITNNTIITIVVGGTNKNSSISGNNIATITSLAGNNGNTFNGGNGVGGGIGGNGGNSSNNTKGTPTFTITFLGDNLSNSLIKICGGGGGGGGLGSSGGAQGGANGGGGGGGGCGTLSGGTSLGGTGNNGNAGQNGSTEDSYRFGGNGGDGFSFSTGGVGGGGGGGGYGTVFKTYGQVGSGGLGGNGAVMLYFLTPSRTQTLYVDGNATITRNCTASSFQNLSDYRIKENVCELGSSLINVNNLRPVLYKNIITNTQDVGFIAHEVKEHYPFLVSGEKDGPNNQSLNYIGLIPILVKTVQELSSNITSLQNEINELKKK